MPRIDPPKPSRTIVPPLRGLLALFASSLVAVTVEDALSLDAGETLAMAMATGAVGWAATLADALRRLPLEGHPSREAFVSAIGIASLAWSAGMAAGMAHAMPYALAFTAQVLATCAATLAVGLCIRILPERPAAASTAAVDALDGDALAPVPTPMPATPGTIRAPAGMGVGAAVEAALEPARDWMRRRLASVRTPSQAPFPPASGTVAAVPIPRGRDPVGMPTIDVDDVSSSPGAPDVLPDPSWRGRHAG